MNKISRILTENNPYGSMAMDLFGLHHADKIHTMHHKQGTAYPQVVMELHHGGIGGTMVPEKYTWLLN